jgi:sterol desaturase/sphingolipid hydroxylase (fatty acid hydroxylase superfamily)
MSWLDHASDILGLEMARLFFAPMSRTFLPFLIVGMVCAMVMMWREHRTQLAPHERLMSRETWLSRSAMNDYGLIFLNVLVLTLIIGPFMPDVVANTAAMGAALSSFLPPLADASPVWLPLALAFTLFVVDDFVRYAVHFAEHRIPALWELHKVHHSALVLNFMTAERHHPLSLMVFNMVNGLGIVLVNALFLALFPGKVSLASLLGGNAFWVAINLFGGVLRHSPVWISFGPKIERWLISPAQHQVHHSTDAKHFDRNFGSSLAVWDRLFGTLYTTTVRRERITYGLAEGGAGYLSLCGLYLSPIRKLLARL